MNYEATLSDVLKNLRSRLPEVSSESELNQLRSEVLGKKGPLNAIFSIIGKADPDDKRKLGIVVKNFKVAAEDVLAGKRREIASVEKAKQLGDAAGDVTLPGVGHRLGGKHPITCILTEIVGFFEKRGFVTVSGPEVESDYYNFEALNIAADHPARATQDSFYFDPNYLLRTQTSNMQIHVAEKISPPIAIISPGRVFRRDTVDATHSYFFHQVEGMLIDENVSFSHLKSILHEFCYEMFGSSVNVRFRPDYFPFTEPSCEVAIEYAGRSEGWLEILGAGMMNPKVLTNVNINPEKYSAYAFGLGVERIAMIKYGIEDIRLFYENDLDFLGQFK